MKAFIPRPSAGLCNGAESVKSKIFCKFFSSIMAESVNSSPPLTIL